MSGPGESAPAKVGSKMKPGVVLLFVLWNAVSFVGAWWWMDGARGTLRGISNLEQGVVYEVLHQTAEAMGGDVGYLVHARTLPSADNKDAKPGDPRWYDLPANPPAAHFIVVELYGKPHLMKSPDGQ